MNKFLEIFMGLILLVVAIYVWGINWSGFGSSAIVFLKGAIMWVVLFIGLALVLLGFNDLRN